MSLRIAVVDYGSGNLRSVAKALECTGATVRVVHEPSMLEEAEALVVPGVGSFGDCVHRLKKENLWEPIRHWLKTGKPYLGICLGYQLLFESSEEHPDIPGLGYFRGRVKKFQHTGLKVPHMGWNTLELHGESPLFKGMTNESYVYFVHSFYPDAEKEIVTSFTDYGEKFASSVRKDAVFATQFHPEKSQEAGLTILRNFVSYCTCTYYQPSI